MARKKEIIELLGELGEGPWRYLAKKQHKYRAIKCETEDGKFDSKAELKRWEDLKLLQRDGRISDLTRDRQECTFLLHGVNGTVVCKYISDSRYKENGVQVVEDKKGMRTDAYRIKRKLFLAEYGQQYKHRES